MYDAIVVGSSYAGMAAALQLVRGRREVLVLDAGVPRNRFASTSYGVLGHDRKPPSAIVSEAKGQLLAYPNLVWREGTAVSAEKIGGSFTVYTAQTEALTSKQLIIATGVSDELPEIPGLAERWGRSVFHCPYCHGYELNGGALGVLATDTMSFHQALIIPDWGPTTFFTHGVFEPDEDQLRQLQARGVTLERELVTEISGGASIHLRSGRVIDLVGLFLASKTTSASPLAEQLGCEFEEGPLGSYVKADGTKETSVPGLFACGDAARSAGNITFAIADGTMAGLAAHRSLMFSGLASNTR